ncbi:multidrug MFS transporter [Bacillus sp. Soil745]|uniref:MFS transporter n=1 Tax=Peribacillus frigoritolerans TaxID=450367 RepID=UPI00070FCE02|nr:MFS transporter [Peribacillus frigoritolerans]KRF47911.1 multidrug MFS transporter [Bacillus sp. Soil745]MED3707748.1 MFS transporter [Peribacillus frigoritolerans]PAW28246.1 MFS transporter [Peribacillus simplex]CAH0289147.1 Purine efflux pump PbuE [Peribacillus frigoritolerans]
MDQSSTRLWTKDFVIVSSINFFITLIFYLLMVTLAIYAVNELDASTSEAGLISGIFIIGTLIGRLFIGRFIDSIGRKKTLFIGLIFFTLTTLLYFVDLGIGFLLVNRLIHGMAMGMASTATGTIVAQIIPPTRKGEGIGYYSMSATLATAIGPFIGLFMAQHTSFQIIFSFCLALGVISLITAFFLYVPALKVTAKVTESKGFKLSNFIEPKALPISIITLLLAFCYSSVLSFISFYAIEIDLVNTASFFFVVYAVAVLISRPFSGPLMDRKGSNFIMYPAFIIFGVGLLLLSMTTNSFTLLAAGFLIGLGFGNMQSSSQAIAVKLTPPHRMGMATSTFFIMLDAGLGFGPYILGFIIPITGYSTLYVILGVLVILTSVLYHFLHGKKERTARTNLASI